MSDVKKGVEAILFAAGRVVQVKELQDLLNVKDKGLIVEAVRELIEDYGGRESPLMIIEEEDGWKLTVREAYLEVVHSINPHTELSKSILETLAVIAWKQPMLQSDVIKIRTNKAYDHISELVSLGFITRERFGRSYLIKVTQKFLDYFDLPEPKAMKDMFKDFKDIEGAVKNKGVPVSAEKPVQQGEDTPVDKSIDAPVEGVELDTYVDALPHMEMPKTEREIDTYEYPADIKTPEKEESEDEKELEEEKLVEAEAAFAQEAEAEEEESPDEKARRLAKAVLGDEEEMDHEAAEEDERKLHPKLEEFIASEHDVPESGIHKAPEGSEDKSADNSAKGEADEDIADSEEDDSLGSEEGSGADKPKVAEEYPGQFADQEEDAGDDSEDDKKDD